ncbi:hypothetical protein [Streptomyces sp. NPDC001020]
MTPKPANTTGATRPIEEYQRLRRISEDAEEEWLNWLAREAESEGAEGSVSLKEMTDLLRGRHD